MTKTRIQINVQMCAIMQFATRPENYPKAFKLHFSSVLAKKECSKANRGVVKGSQYEVYFTL